MRTTKIFLKTGTLVLTLAFATSGSVALAQDSTDEVPSQRPAVRNANDLRNTNRVEHKIQDTAVERKEVRERIGEHQEDRRAEPIEQRKEVRARLTESARERVTNIIEEHREKVRTTIEERRGGLEERIEEKRAEIMERREEIKKRLDEQAQDRIAKVVENVTNAFIRVLNNYSNVAERLEERILRAKESGYSIEQSSEALASAQATIETSISDIENLKDRVGSELESNGEVSNLTIRAAIEEGRGYVKEAREELTNALRVYGSEIDDGNTSDENMEENGEDETEESEDVDNSEENGDDQS